MAILEQTSYIKIIPSECYILDNMIYVSFEEYLTEEDRIKEKVRVNDFNNFYEKVNSALNSDIDLIDNDALWNRVSAALGLIKCTFIQYNKDNKTIIDLDQDAKTYLTNCGLKEEWYLDPIIKYPIRTVYCGVYKNEDLTTEFYYNKLKSVMNAEIIQDK